MRTLHFDLKAIQGDTVELRSFWDNPNDYDSRSLSLSEINNLLRQAEENYYVSPRLQADLATTGRILFQWLDGKDRWLVKHLGQYPGEGIVLAIAVAGKLAHLPWEVLHDGAQFLVQRQPAIVPVRWISSDQVTRLTVDSQPQNRALNVLFMATSPRDVNPVLDYEQEEAAILKATARPTIGLTVEESGCLKELGYLIDGHDERFFDVVHLTGHATIQDGEPRFITETATGEAHYASALEIARTLKTPMPPLVFLSGCRTGQAGNAGAVPSMAEQLLQYGATAVLGWGQNVLDTDATAAAAALYESLSRSDSIAQAVAFAYQKLIEQEARDWHLLRLYGARTLPGSLVKPSRTPGWRRAPAPSMATEFLDPATKQIKVPTRESFVGRRRQLQNCLRALTASSETIGVLIHGMGGLGKSSLAARLCDRLPQFKRLVWQGRLDPARFVNELAKAIDHRSIRQRLQDPDEELPFRLRGVFHQLMEQGAPAFLLVFDDFEVNLDAQGAGYVLKAPTVEVLQALIWSIRDPDAPHRFILTSRYDVEMDQDQVLYRQPMDALQGADLRKKCSRLSALKPPELQVQATAAEREAATQTWQLQEQAKVLADGNPRLLEKLNDEVLAKDNIDRATRLQNLAADRTELRNQVLEERVLQQMQAGLQEILARGLVFELPVPRAAFEAVCTTASQVSLQNSRESESQSENSQPLGNSQPHERKLIPLEDSPARCVPQARHLNQNQRLIEQAIALGLLEVSADAAVRVPRILPLSLPKETEHFYTEAARCLYHLWWNRDQLITAVQGLEIVRLGLLAGESEITTDVGNKIAIKWFDCSHYREAHALCQTILSKYQDYRILGTIACAEEAMGNIEAATAYYERALELCPEQNIFVKASILGNMAGVISQQGDVDRAMQLWKESLKLQEQISDLGGKASTLGSMAQVISQQGDVKHAMQLLSESLKLSEQVNNVQGIVVTLHNMAVMISEQDVDRAMQLWEESLKLQEQINDVQGKAATMSSMARVIARQGDVNRAMQLLKQSLQIQDKVNDVKGKAASLHSMAGVISEQGDTNRAMQLWEESLKLREQINDVRGKAEIFNNMALIMFEQGEKTKVLELLQEAARIFAKTDGVVSLLTVLQNLSIADDNSSQVYLAQAIWLGLRIYPSLKLIHLLQSLYECVFQQDEIAALLATTALFSCGQLVKGSYARYPQLDSFGNISLDMLAGTATAQGIVLQSCDDLFEWMADNQLNDPNVFLPQLNQRLEAMVGDQWLFDPNGFAS